MLKAPAQATPFIRVFKLSSGEEIVARVIEVSDREFVVEKPLTPVATERGTTFVPYTVLGKKDGRFNLNRDVIVFDVEPMSEVESHYETLISGIAVPAKGSIIV
jgi:hypothetical protein